MNERVVTLVLNTRQTDRENLGDLREFFQSVRTSTKDPSRIEMIFKLDDDDLAAQVMLEQLKGEFPEIVLKYFRSPRYGYRGLFIGYAEAMKYISPKSVAVLPVADDMPFVGKTEWDQSCIDKSNEFPDGIYILQMAPIGQFTDGVFFGSKLIELVGFGPTLAVDQWGCALANSLVKMGMSKRVESITACGGRKGCALDFPTNPVGLERWNGPRKDAMDLIGSDYFKWLIGDAEVKIERYLQEV